MRFMISAAATLLQLGLLILLTVGPVRADCGPALDQAYIRCLRMQQCVGACPHDGDCRSIKKEALQCYAQRDKARKAENDKETQEYLVKAAQNPGWPCLDQNTCYPQFVPKACYGFVPGARPPYTEQMLNNHQPRCRNEISELLDAMRRVNSLPKLTPQEAERELHMMPDSPTLMTRQKLVDVEARILKEKEPAANPNEQRRQYQRQEVDLFMANCGPNSSPELRAMCPGVRRLLARKAKAGDPVARCLVNGNSNCANAR